VSEIIKIERKGKQNEKPIVKDLKEKLIKNLKQRLKIAVSSVENDKFKIDGNIGDIGKLLKKDKVQEKISGFFDQQKRQQSPDVVGEQTGGNNGFGCCYFLFLCFFFSIWFNNISTLQGKCAMGNAEACQENVMAADNFAENFLTLSILDDSNEANVIRNFGFNNGGRKRKRTKKKKRRKKKKGTKKRR